MYGPTPPLTSLKSNLLPLLVALTWAWVEAAACGHYAHDVMTSFPDSTAALPPPIEVPILENLSKQGTSVENTYLYVVKVALVYIDHPPRSNCGHFVRNFDKRQRK